MPIRATPLGLARPVARRGGARAPSAAGAAAAKSLDFEMQHQQQTDWCWSAVGTSVGLYFRTGDWTQCDTATGCLGGGMDCCQEPTPCDHYGFLNQALEYTKTLVSYEQRAGTETEVRTQIDQDKPVCALVNWHGGGAHFMAIVGYTDPGSRGQGLSIVIQDSQYGGPTILPFAEFPDHYQSGGEWTFVYFTGPQGET